jgi:hypothetical protein
MATQSIIYKASDSDRILQSNPSVLIIFTPALMSSSAAAAASGKKKKKVVSMKASTLIDAITS